MPVDQTSVTKITCDNPTCPNTKKLPDGLSNDDLAGWLLVTSEVYGEASESNVFCSFTCAAAAADARAAA